MDGLSEKLCRCFATHPQEEEEEEEIAVEDEPVHVNMAWEIRNLVGRLVSPKILTGFAIKMHLTRLIQHVRAFTLQDLGPNKFVLHFDHPRDCALALDGSPWLVDRCATLLLSLEEGTDPG